MPAAGAATLAVARRDLGVQVMFRSMTRELVTADLVLVALLSPDVRKSTYESGSEIRSSGTALKFPLAVGGT